MSDMGLSPEDLVKVAALIEYSFNDIRSVGFSQLTAKEQLIVGDQATFQRLYSWAAQTIAWAKK